MLVVDLQLACRVAADLNYHPNGKNGPPSIPSALHHSPQDRDHLAMWGMPQDPQLLHAWVVRQLLGIGETLVLHDYHGFGGCWCVSYHHFFQRLEINEMSWPTTTSITGWWFNWDDEIPNFLWKVIKFHGSKAPHLMMNFLAATLWSTSLLVASTKIHPPLALWNCHTLRLSPLTHPRIYFLATEKYPNMIRSSSISSWKPCCWLNHIPISIGILSILRYGPSISTNHTR